MSSNSPIDDSVVLSVYQTVSEDLQHSLSVVDEDARILWFSDEKKIGTHILGRLALDFMQPQFHKAYMETLARVSLSGISESVDFVTLPGRYWEVRISALPHKSNGKSLFATVGRPRDDKTTEWDFDSKIDSTRIAIGTTDIGVWEWNIDDDLVHLDLRARAIHGLPASTEKLTAAEFMQTVHKEDRGHVIRACVDSSINFRNIEYRLSGDTERWAVLHGNFVRIDNRRPHAVGSCFDISERKQLEARMLSSQKLETVGQLTAGIAHNFNNLLSAILPSLHLAGRHVSPPGQEYLRNAVLAAERASDLVGELMVVAGRKVQVARSEFDVGEMTSRVLRICRTTMIGGAQIEWLAPSRSHLVLGDQGQLEQVLLNLLLNARDVLTEEIDPRIRVSLKSEAGQVAICVADNGPGMAPEVCERIFEPFFTTKESGTGLGLATAKAIANEHNGSLECISSPGKGTRFLLSLPELHSPA